MGKSKELYDRDFFDWTVENAALLRQGKLDQADLEHIAEEIEDMGKRDRREVQSRLIVLIAHLLKWQFQPDHRGSGSWTNTISRERTELPLIFDQSPSLRRYAEQDLETIYRRAVRLASDETGIPAASLPERCPFALDQILEPGFFPG